MLLAKQLPVMLPLLTLRERLMAGQLSRVLPREMLLEPVLQGRWPRPFSAPAPSSG